MHFCSYWKPIVPCLDWGRGQVVRARFPCGSRGQVVGKVCDHMMQLMKGPGSRYNEKLSMTKNLHQQQKLFHIKCFCNFVSHICKSIIATQPISLIKLPFSHPSFLNTGVIIVMRKRSGSKTATFKAPLHLNKIFYNSSLGHDRWVLLENIRKCLKSHIYANGMLRLAGVVWQTF